MEIFIWETDLKEIGRLYNKSGRIADAAYYTEGLDRMFLTLSSCGHLLDSNNPMVASYSPFPLLEL